MKRHASAVWNGTLKEGRGTLSTESGALSQLPYRFAARFESEEGTNPEELVGAAHAGCFAMALSAELQKAGFTPRKIEVRSTVAFEKDEKGWGVHGLHLDVSAAVDGATEEEFLIAAETARVGCPIARLLNAPISMSARLSSKTEAA